MSGREFSGDPVGTVGAGTVGDSPEELLGLARDQALAAGALLLDSYREGTAHEIDSKSTPTDLVSEADHLAERTIREGLAAARPRDGFLGEESGGEVGASGLRWVVDPLDGTVNFLFGIPQWCVSIAVQDAAGSLVGVIYDPLRGDLFSAVRGGRPRVEFVPAATGDGAGAVGQAAMGGGLVRQGQPRVEFVPAAAAGERAGAVGQAATGGGVGVATSGQEGTGSGLAHRGQALALTASRCTTPATAMVATGFAYDARVRAAQARVLARVIPAVRDIRRFGSAALDLAWTAAGRYDAYFERTVKPWDIAAGTLICEAAGLCVVELPVHEALPWGILVAPPGLCDSLLPLVGGAG